MALSTCLLLAALIGQTEGYGGKGGTILSECLDGGRKTHFKGRGWGYVYFDSLNCVWPMVAIGQFDLLVGNSEHIY